MLQQPWESEERTWAQPKVSVQQLAIVLHCLRRCPTKEDSFLNLLEVGLTGLLETASLQEDLGLGPNP